MEPLRRKPRWILLSPLAGLLLVAGGIGWVLWQLRPAADRWDPDNAPASAVRVMFSGSPRMQAIRDAMANAYVDLEKQEKLARAEGILLSAADVALRHVPDARNAAIPARKLWDALRAKPIPDNVKTILEKGPASDGDARALADFLKARPDLLPMVDAITARPDFSLNRTWTPEEIEAANDATLGVLRDAARLLRARAFLLTREGNYPGAMDLNRQALKLATFAWSEHGLIPWLVGRATEAEALESIQFTLARAGTSDGIAASATEALRSMPPMPSVADPIRFEALDGYTRLPKDDLLTYSPAAPPVIPAPRGKNPLSHGRLEAAGLAEYLRQMRLALAAAKAPDPMRSAPMHELNRVWSGEIPRTPQSLYADTMVPRVSRVLRRAAESQAHRDITLAAAEVLAQKARTGSLPTHLPADISAGPLRPLVSYNRSGDGFTLSATVRKGEFQDGYPEDTPDTTFRFEYPTKTLTG